MYMGGMHVTLLPMKQPSRMLEPPGTMRTPLAAVKCFTGHVALSKNGCRAASTDMSTIPPMRNPSRIPFFTHGLTRQPVFEDESGSAARTAPVFSASLRRANSAKCSSV